MVVLVVLVACHPSSPRSAPTNATPPAAPPADTAPELTACQRYEELGAKVDACQGLSDEIKQGIAQRRTDTMASISESGMDDSTPVDPEALCEQDAAYLLRVAKQPCGL